MIKIGNKNKNVFTLQAILENEIELDIIKKDNIITEDIASKKAYVYFEDELNQNKIKKFAEKIAFSNRDYQIDISTFKNKNIKENEVIRILVDRYNFINDKIYNVKTSKQRKIYNIILINTTKIGNDAYKKAMIYSKAINYVRNYQTMPPNILNSIVFAKKIQEDLKKHKNLNVKVLKLKEIEELKMGLLLSVNSASQNDARVVVVEYKGDPNSKEKTVFVGKGIMFDAGGMNIKTGKYMLGMKYDMSGAAISIGAIKTIAQLKPKKNVSVVVGLTDNMVSATASMPDSVYKSMNGKTVEVNNTDAEGRLVLADTLTYAIKKLKATRVIDIATLTGAVTVALGHTYTGVWSTTEKGWQDLQAAAKLADELVWRMPLHEDFFKFMKGCKTADMFNTDYSGRGGSNSAAMFLTQFNEGVEHIHLDIAGTADINGVSQAPIVKTLIELSHIK